MAQLLLETEMQQCYTTAFEKEVDLIMLKSTIQTKNGELLFETYPTSNVYLYSFEISSGLFISATGNKNDLPPQVTASIYSIENFECIITN